MGPTPRFAAPVVLVVCLLWAMPAAGAEPLSNGLPLDTIGFVELSPAHASGGPVGQSIMGLAVQAMNSAGGLGPKASWALNMAELATVAGDRPSCLAWTGGQLTVDINTGLLSVSSMEMMWIIDVDDPRPTLDRLTAVLATMSSKETARQEVKSLGDAKYVEFSDVRWPAWMRMSWLQEPHRLVITVGDQGMKRYLEHEKGERPWRALLDPADVTAIKSGVEGAVVGRFYLSTEEMRRRWPDVMKISCLSQVTTAMQGDACDACAVTARQAGREIQLYASSMEHGLLTQTPWTEHVAGGSELMGMVPGDADCFLALHVDWPAVYERVLGLTDALAGNDESNDMRNKIRLFPALYGVNLENDIVRNLSPVVLVDNSPRLPARLPLLGTAILAAEAGSETRVRDASGKLLHAAKMALDREATPGLGSSKPAGDQDLFLMEERKAMFLQYVLRGPAWEWSGRRLVVSWSPPALRDVLRDLPELKGTGDAFGIPVAR